MESIEIHYIDSNNETDVSISLTIEYEDVTTGQLLVNGNNSIWVDGVLSRFSHIIDWWNSKSMDIVKAIQNANEQNNPVVNNPTISQNEDPISETRKFSVSSVVITVENLRELANIMDESARKAKESEYRIRRAYIETQDGSEYKGSPSNVLSQGGILDIKQVKSIRMVFEDALSEDRPSITIYLKHGEIYGKNFIEVIGNDSTWVNGVMRRFEDAVRGWERQATWPRWFQWLLVALFVLGIERIFILAAPVIFNQNSAIFPQVDFLLPIGKLISATIFYTLLAALIAIPGYLITEKLLELWPIVELRTGREYAQIYRKRRNQLWAIMSLIILPLLVTFLYDLIKAFVQ